MAIPFPDSLTRLRYARIATCLKGALRFCRRFIPVSESYEGDNFFTVRDGVRMATPLLLALAVVELSDVAFAVDSIPAVRFVAVVRTVSACWGWHSALVDCQTDGLTCIFS